MTFSFRDAEPMELIFAVVGVGCLTIFHARRIRISITAWSVNHCVDDDVVKSWTCNRIWNFSAHNFIDQFSSGELVFSSQNDKHVRMGQAAFLKFNCIYVCHRLAQNAIFDEVLV